MTLPPASQFDELLDAYKQGDAAAFEKFFRLSKDAVYAYALKRIKDPQRAADVTQETYLRVHRYIQSFKPADGLAIGWVFGITRNCVADHLRERQSESVDVNHGELTGKSSWAADDRALFGDLLQNLERNISREDIELLVERTILELSFEEIAQKHGIQSANARQRFGRILKKLRDII